MAAALAAALAIGLTATAMAEPASGAATLQIHIRNVSSQGGVMRLGLYDAAGYRTDTNPVASADVPVVDGETVITLKNLVPGIYAIEAYQDVNANDRMDKSWIGLPMEPYGFSRDAHPVLSKPGFDRVKFTVAAGSNTQVLHLQNSSPPGVGE
jgi:uncharacterized protein (DUF2141 family)